VPTHSTREQYQWVNLAANTDVPRDCVQTAMFPELLTATQTGVVVNLDEQTVFFLGYVVPIDNVDGASINFGGRQIVDYGFSIAIRGKIDRTTGRMDAIDNQYWHSLPAHRELLRQQLQKVFRWHYGCHR
jgi:hypothetical protein